MRAAPISIDQPGAVFAQPLEREFRGVRLAWSRNLGGLPVDRRVTAALEAQRGVFEKMGMIVEEADADWSGADEVFKVLRAYSFELNYGALLKNNRAQLKDTVIWNIEQGRGSPVRKWPGRGQAHRALSSGAAVYGTIRVRAGAGGTGAALRCRVSLT